MSTPFPTEPATPHPANPFRIGTRGSPLAMAQAHMVRDHLVAAHGWHPDAVVIVPIRTTGDRVQDRPLAEIGGKALWTKELDRALIAGEIDCSVHSMKDVESWRPDCVALTAILPREDVHDRLIGAESIDALPHGARVGTSSPRRRAQLLHHRPDLRILMFRGNVDTRLSKLAAGEADATLLAAAGLNRLGRPEIGHAIPIDTILPAAAQGAVGVETRADDRRARDAMAAIDHPATHACVLAERALLAALGGDCRSPVAALATLEGAVLTLQAEVLSEDGTVVIRAMESGAPEDPELPAAMARDLLARAPESVRNLFTA